MEENIENLDSPNEESETDNSTNVEEEASEEVDVEAIKKENADLKKTNQLLYEKEKKARGLVRNAEGQWVKKEPIEPKVEEKTETKSDYSLQDIRALSDVHDEDVQEVVDFAKFKGISIADAKKNSTIQILLKNKEEERKSAQATNTGGGKRGSSKVTAESIFEKALSTGEVPEDDEGIDKLAAARVESLKPKTQ